MRLLLHRLLTKNLRQLQGGGLRFLSLQTNVYQFGRELTIKSQALHKKQRARLLDLEYHERRLRYWLVWISNRYQRRNNRKLFVGGRRNSASNRRHAKFWRPSPAEKIATLLVSSLQQTLGIFLRFNYILRRLRLTIPFRWPLPSWSDTWASIVTRDISKRCRRPSQKNLFLQSTSRLRKNPKFSVQSAS